MKSTLKTKYKDRKMNKKKRNISFTVIFQNTKYFAEIFKKKTELGSFKGRFFDGFDFKYSICPSSIFYRKNCKGQICDMLDTNIHISCNQTCQSSEGYWPPRNKSMMVLFWVNKELPSVTTTKKFTRVLLNTPARSATHPVITHNTVN